MIIDNDKMTPEQRAHFDRMVAWNSYWREQDKSLWNKERHIGLGTVVCNVPRLYVLKPNVKPCKFVYDTIKLFETKITSVKIVFAIRSPQASDKADKYVDLWIPAYDIEDFQSKLKIWIDCVNEMTIFIGPQLA